MNKITKLTTSEGWATLYEVLVGGQVRWHRRVRRTRTPSDRARLDAAVRERDRVAARLAAAVGAVKVAVVLKAMVRVPGTKGGRCVGDCRHSGCSGARIEAEEMKCSICGEPFGYGRWFLVEEAPGHPFNERSVHADCAEGLSEENVSRASDPANKKGLLINFKRWKLGHLAQVRRLERKARLRSRSTVVDAGDRPRTQVITFPSPTREAASVSEHPVPTDALPRREDDGEKAQALHTLADHNAAAEGKSLTAAAAEMIADTITAGHETASRPRGRPRRRARPGGAVRVTKQTRYRNGAWIYEVLVGQRVRWRRRVVPYHHKLGEYSRTAREQDRVAARLAKAVLARTELKGH